MKMKRYRTLKIDIVLLLSIFIALFIALALNSKTLVSALTGKISESNRQVLQYCTNRVSGRLSQIETYMFAYLIEDEDMSILRYDSKNMPARMRVINDLSGMYANYGDVNGFFIYMPDIKFMPVKTWKLWDLKDDMELRSFIEKNYKAEKNMEGWEVVELNGKKYLYLIKGYRNQCIGAVISLEDLKKWVAPESMQEFEDIILVENRQEETGYGRYQYVYNVEGKEYLMISEGLPGTCISYCGVILNQNIIGVLNQWQFNWILLILLSGVFLSMGVVFLYRSIVRPLTGLERGMHAFAEGNLDVKVREDYIHRELQHIGKSFNDMTAQIKSLKIGLYERELERQQIQLKYLRLQTNPHFFLNTLNVIYSLTLSKDISTIKSLVLCLTKHSRYILKARQDKVSLHEELAYIQNYMEIQKIRFPYRFKGCMLVEEGLDEVKIPPFLLQTFVENAFKYGLVNEEILEIILKVEKREKNWLWIHIEDNGNGFSREVLDILDKREKSLDKNGDEHYGIRNILERLDILYKGSYKVNFYNGNQRGAQIEIWIPLESKSDF